MCGKPNLDDAEDFEDVVDLTPGQIEEFMEVCSEQTIAGLRVFAEHGPVIRAKLLNEAGIENYGHFQGRVPNAPALSPRFRGHTSSPGMIGPIILTKSDFMRSPRPPTGRFASTSSLIRNGQFGRRSLVASLCRSVIRPTA